MCWNATWRTKIVRGGLSLTHTERQAGLPFTTEEPRQRGAAPSPRQLFSGGTATFPTLLLTYELRWERFPKIHM